MVLVHVLQETELTMQCFSSVNIVFKFSMIKDAQLWHQQVQYISVFHTKQNEATSAWVEVLIQDLIFAF